MAQKSNGTSEANQKTLPYIKNLSPSDKKKFLDSFDTVFCDCDGVVWYALHDGIPGSAKAIDFLQQQGKQVTYVTNNSISSTQDILRKFERCQIKAEQRDIIHPAQTVCNYLRSIKFEGLIYCLANRPFKDLLRDAGFQLVKENSVIPESIQELRAAIYSTDPVKAVIIDVDFNLTAPKLMRAHLHLKDPDCLFIGGAADMLISFGGGDIIGPGAFLSVVEKSTKRNAVVLGKPGKELRDILLERYKLKDPQRALFVGDSLTSDISFGKMCGFQTLVVLTGGTHAPDLEGDLPEDETPDYVADCLGDFTELLN